METIDQMTLMYKCSSYFKISNMKNFWSLNKREIRKRTYSTSRRRLGWQGDKVNKDNRLAKLLDACQSQTILELIPYLDDSVIAEFLLYKKARGKSFASTIASLCDGWLSMDLTSDRVTLPPIDRERLFYAMSEMIRIDKEDYFRVSGQHLINNGLKLTEDERMAIYSYTTDSYHNMNVYESWGRLGLALYGDKTNENIAKRVKDLKALLPKMAKYQGVTFGAHTLSSHLFKNYKPGDVFSPGFFMSTSRSVAVAEGFLLSKSSRSEQKVLMFVVKSKSGSSISNQSVYSKEAEVLLYPDAKYRVLKREPYILHGKVLPNAEVIYIDEI